MKNPETKSLLHPKNKHRKRYDFNALSKTLPELKQFVRLNPHGDHSINFFDPKAVKTLNKALLKEHYQIDFWDIPEGFLCPPIPGRADYIHYLADLLKEDGPPPSKGNKITCLDLGTGASCIYPLLGQAEYDWNFVGTDINHRALKSAQQIIQQNQQLKDKISLRRQKLSTSVLQGIIDSKDRFDAVLCNPPFHSSAKEAEASSTRKNTNLRKKKSTPPTLNFGGKENELWCDGGEYRFIQTMIRESRDFSDNCLWYTTLVSKKDNLRHFYKALQEVKANRVETIEMRQGQKISRILCWTFLPEEKRSLWKELRW